MALVGLASADASAVGFSRKPYVQQPTSDSALVAFTLDASCPAAVRYGVGGDRSQVAESSGAGSHHAVRLSGLPAASEVGYEVEGCGEPTGEGGSFRTAPVPGTRRVHFAAIGDFGTGGDIQQELVQSLVDARPELMLALGDVAYDSGTPTEVEEHFIRPMARLFSQVPVYVALGNHEYMTDAGRPTLDAIHMPANNEKKTERYYSFDWGHVHFVALDSMCSGTAESGGECTAEEQEAWLRNDLASTDQPWKVVFFHHPAYSSSPKTSRSIQEKIVPILEEGGVDLVLAGHAHNYERSFPMWEGERDDERGLTYVVAGAGGAKLKYFDDEANAPSWSAYRNNTEFGYLEVNVEGGTLSGEARTMEGRVIDSFTLTKELPDAPAPGPILDPGTNPGSTPDPNGGESPIFEPGGASCSTAGAGMLLPAGMVLALALGARRRRRRS